MEGDVKDLEKGTGTETIKEVNFASFYQCPVCRQAMTLKTRKLTELRPGVFAHNLCAEIFMQNVRKGIASAETNKEETV